MENNIRPSPINVLPVSLGALSEHDLSYRSIAEQDEEQDPKELGERLTHDLSEVEPGSGTFFRLDDFHYDLVVFCDAILRGRGVLLTILQIPFHMVYVVNTAHVDSHVVVRLGLDICSLVKRENRRY